MSIDTLAKRRSAAHIRLGRLPWSRRIMPVPSGSILTKDKQFLLVIYVGLLISVPAVLGNLTASDNLFYSILISDQLVNNLTISDLGDT